MERDCCEFICGAMTTFQGYGIELNQIEGKVALECAKCGKVRAQLGQLKTGQDGKGLLRIHLWCHDDLPGLWDRIESNRRKSGVGVRQMWQS